MKPKFYSKEAIAGLTLLSPILGCILFSYNLRAIGKGRFSPYFIIASIIWILLIKGLLTGKIDDPLFQLLIAGISGSLLMTFFIWDKFLSSYPIYEKKKVWKPILIFLGICVALIAFQLLMSKNIK